MQGPRQTIASHQHRRSQRKYCLCRKGRRLFLHIPRLLSLPQTPIPRAMAPHAALAEQMSALLSQYNHDQVHDTLAAFTKMHKSPPKTKIGGVSKSRKASHRGRQRSAKPSFALSDKGSDQKDSPGPLRPLNSWMAFRSECCQA